LVARNNCCQGRRRSSAPLAGRKPCCQGRRRASAPRVGGKTCCRGRRRALVPRAERKSGYRGRRGGVVPLVDGKSCCQGRRKTAVSRAGDNVIAFFVRWTRSDFRGCTRYTQCGAEGVLRRGRWTWYRPSKWTWSTAVPKAGGSRCVCQDRGIILPGDDGLLRGSGGWQWVLWFSLWGFGAEIGLKS